MTPGKMGAKFWLTLILVYLGDSATLSFLQLVRMMVEPVVGNTPFTNDPRRHMITEAIYSLPADTTLTMMLPDYKTAHLLSESFFLNVS